MQRTLPRARRGLRALVLAGVALFLAVSPGLAQDADPAKGLKSKVVAERLAAVAALRASSDPQAEKLLIGALADKDLEVEHRAVEALADRGTNSSAALLVRECVDAPIRRVRAAAARTLAKIAPERGSAELAKLTSGKSAVRALEALAIVGRGTADDAAVPAVQRALKSKDFAVRLAAARGIPCLPEPAAGAALSELLATKDVELSSAALRAVAQSGEAQFAPALLAALGDDSLSELTGRRVVAALAAVRAAAASAAAIDDGLDAAIGQGKPHAVAQALRVARQLIGGATPNTALRDRLAPRIVAALTHADASVRKAAVCAALRAAPPLGKDECIKLGAHDGDAVVRTLALRELVRAFGIKDEAVAALALDRLAGDASASVRTEAAVVLGAPMNPPGAPAGNAPGNSPANSTVVAALARALADPEWTVATCAAVSLGKTGDAGVRTLLEGEFAKADWRARASAVVGLAWLWDKAAVPALIRALGDADPTVRMCAHAFLERELKAGIAADRAAWEAWWAENEKRVRLVDPAVLEERRKRYGYASRPEEVYADLDVVVLESRGDHIERLLDQLKIRHRMTQAAKLGEAGLSPWGIYVSNCTGEIEKGDVERIAWYVHSGGMLFGSCWSLYETIVRVHPGVLARKDTKNEVLDDVSAEPVDRSSPYLDGVFPDDLVPLYHLEGAYLIDVLEPELCEVLIDSPEAEKRWGSGNLAAWFPSGHGRILDSVNHFDLQGLEVAPGLKTAEDRVAFAFDRMGMDYETWRSTQGEKWWENSLKASQHVFDMSALRFVTNFVRAKRLRDG